MIRSVLKAAIPGLAILLAGLVSPAHAIDYLNVTIQPDRAVPGACLSFSADLPRGQTSALDPFIAIEPKIDHGLQARGKDLCITGLRHGQHYTVNVRAGLKAADGSTLPRDVPVAIQVPDRDPQLSFDQGKNLLPWRKGVGLPLKSVNVGKARIVVYRFGERALAEQVSNDWFGQALNGWNLDTIADRSQKVFEGNLDITAQANQQVTTAIPLDQLIKTMQPGIYVATAVPDGVKPESDVERATQWFSVSDIGLFTVKTDGGMLISAHGLEGGKPMAGVEVRLVAVSNEILGSYKTDGEGRALIPGGLLKGEHGDAPRILSAMSDRGDFTWMPLDKPALDLSDLDVKGRTPPGPRDAFLWSDRGIYRPGETIHLGALLRDNAGKPLQNLPLTLHLVRPDGIEISQMTPDMSHAGGGTIDIPVPDNAYTGNWTIWASAGGKDRIGSLDVSVEDFVPPRLEAKVELPGGPVAAGAAFLPVVTANYFYGSPGSDLTGQVEATIQAAAKPFKDFEDYNFGLVQEPFLQKALEAQSFTTDDKGRAEVTFPAGDAPDTTVPLEIALHAAVNDVDGRPAEATQTAPMHTADRFIGLRAPSTDLADGADAAIDLVLVDGSGKPIPGESLKWDLVKEDYQYTYFYRDGRWQSEEVINDTRVNGGDVALGPDGKATVKARVNNGRWRLEAYDASGKTASSIRFGVGWWSASPTADNPKPETFVVTLDKNPPPGKIRAAVAPSFAGRLLVMLDGNGLHGVQEIDVAKGGTAVDFDASDVPPSGAYVVAVAISPSGAVLPRLPARAVGVTWVPGAAAGHKLDVSIDAPDKIAPKTTLDVSLDVPQAAGTEAYVTLAAVDEAVLRMTDFDTPDPADHYLGKREPGFELRDVYGNLIDPSGQAGRLVEGGDARAKLQMGGLDVKTFKTVALFQGPVKLDGQGKTRVSLAVPEFSGRLRLMAVAWTGDRFGKAERPVTVRPPLLVELTLPRFLAPGDKIRARVMLTDLEAPEQTYTVDLAASGAVSFDRPDALFKDVKRDKRRYVDRVLTANAAPGVGRIHMAVTGQDGTKAERDFEIAVRSPNAYVTTRQFQTLDPDGHLTAGDDLGTGLVPGTGTLDVTVSTVPAFDVPGLLAALRRYPYGCTEQTVSRAFPELFAGRLGATAANAVPDSVTGQGAIARLFSLQAEDGSFGYWSAFDTGHVWLTAYTVDFLQHAKAQGLQVPDPMLARALGWLAGRFATSGNEPGDIAGAAYAALVLARADKIDLSQLRYFASRADGHLPSDVARVQLAATLAHVGERERAAALMRQPPVTRDPKVYLNDYGSPLRDNAMKVSLSAEEKLVPEKAVIDQAADLARATSSQPWLSTQEQAWLLRSAFDLHTKAPLKAEINGKPNQDKTRMANSTPLGKGEQSDIRNMGTQPVYVALATTGIPLAPEPAEANGFTIARSYFHMDGKPADLADVHQNDEIVTVVEGTMADPLERKTLVVDLLPAGLEPDTITISSDQGDDSKFAWLKDLTEPTFKATRDDRYVAGLTLAGEKARFKVAYVVRAVTPGTYALPGAQIEDMYAPAYHARSAPGILEVKGPRSAEAKPAPKADGKPVQPASGGRTPPAKK